MYVQSTENPNWIAEVDDLKSKKYKYRIIINNKEFKKDFEHNHNLKPATEQQIAHLKACIAADKFIPWSENMLISQYEIY